MGVKFFGQYLIENRAIDSDQLRAALDLMDQHNRTLGEIAVAEGILAVGDAEKVNAQQRRRDRHFGALAVEMGMLSEEQLDLLIHLQDRGRLRIGEALVRLGALERPRLEELLARHEAEQAPYRTGDVALPDGLRGHAVAPVVLDLLPRLIMRMSRIIARVGRGEAAGELPELPVRGSVRVVGEAQLLICLAGDEAFARRLGGFESGVERQLLEDGIGEFLNVLAGNATSVAEQRGISSGLAPPEARIALGAGYRFELAVSVGSAALFLEPF